LPLGPVNGVSATGKPTSLLTAPATSANVATMNAAMGGLPNPGFFIAAANAFPNQSTVTIAQMLTAFPQYSSLQDGWGGGFTENFAYHALQITLSQRMAHGISFNFNYTHSKNLGDDGTFRSGYAIPAAAIDGHGQSWKADKIDRSWTTISNPNIINAYSVYQLPFGRGHIGSDSWLVRNLAGGWQLSEIYTYSNGGPFTPTWSSGGNCAGAAPNAGQCMPSLNPNYSGSPRINGSYGKGPNGFVFQNASTIQYVDPNAFQAPADISSTSNSHQYLIGNSPRTRPYNIMNPGNQNINASLRRSFPIYHEMAFVFQADCTNVWNKMVWGGPSGGYSAPTLVNGVSTPSKTFGTIGAPGTAPRDFQLSAHLNF